MKTAIIISTRGYGVFDFTLLKQPNSVRIIGIFAEPDASNLPYEQLPHFHRIHVVPCAVKNPSTLQSALVDFESAYDIIATTLETTALEDLTIHCHDEQNMLLAAKLRSSFGIGGPNYEAILPYRDKCMMKEKLQARDIRVPRFGRFLPDRFRRGAAAYFDVIASEVGLPFILKPVDSVGAEGIHKIGSLRDFKNLPGELGRQYAYEEYIGGTIFSVNIVSRKGHTLFGGVSEHLVNAFDAQAGKVNADINLHEKDPRVPRMLAFAEQALDALGRLEGGAHLELFLTERDELVLLEVAAHFKGMAGLAAMERNYGIALVNLVFEIETGIESLPYQREQTYCFDGVLPKKSGEIDALNTPALESQVKMNWKVAKGERLRQSTSLMANAGTFLVWNKDYDALYRDFKRLGSYEPISYKAEVAQSLL
ncbi:ATP-grasp domain-containing protein [Chitinimonas arctica]|uniref:ATP-grasp domain-containing protein n=1 Tax=Chitinimonas arctica TaxID=2594795 RepID=A0A516SCC6_9NEIS|nr:ATP-grasp domain-containing protein [Chitinimonas arctica]QDQ25802.1 ATP-grasp domain-containing protein [Chitinimonas arctica]